MGGSAMTWLLFAVVLGGVVSCQGTFPAPCYQERDCETQPVPSW